MRTLRKDEIECRLQRSNDNKAFYLLYKTARTDASILTEEFGNRWECSFDTIGGKLFCTISVFNTEIDEWVSRSNVGTESTIEKEKGEASDAFKRAGFMWGIGTELYTISEIAVDINDSDKFNGKCNLKLYIKEIEISTDHKITKLVLVDKLGRIRFDTSSKSTIALPPTNTCNTKYGNDNATVLKTFCTTMKNEGANKDMLKKFYNYWMGRIDEGTFNGKINPQALWEKELARA